jgi:nucleoside-triphosphatase THEP1
MTGARQVGKSTALRRAVDAMRQAGLAVSGLLTERTGPHDLAVTEVHTGATYALTDSFDATGDSPLGNFRMNGAAFVRSARALSESFPTQVFVLDELGPLEFRHRQGWVAAFERLACESYDIAIVVVRPELLGRAVAELPGPWFNLLHITPSNRDRAPAWLLEIALVACEGANLRSGGCYE